MKAMHADEDDRRCKRASTGREKLEENVVMDFWNRNCCQHRSVSLVGRAYA
jgi:hypothetical protein